LSDQSDRKTAMALNFMRSAKAPVISAGVMMANINCVDHEGLLGNGGGVVGVGG